MKRENITSNVFKCVHKSMSMLYAYRRNEKLLLQLLFNVLVPNKSGSGVAWSCEVTQSRTFWIPMWRDWRVTLEPDMCKKYWLSWCRGACPSSVARPTSTRCHLYRHFALNTFKSLHGRTVLFGLVSVMFPLVRKGVADVC